MSTETLPLPGQPHLETGITGQTIRTRVLALDIFRGFAMAVMIFVNDLSDVRGLPAWTYHYPRTVDRMSYVDMVYPFFLFAVGLSLPLAIRQRLRRNPSLLNLWGHILVRGATLIALGLIIANAQNTSASSTHMRGSLWAFLSLLGAVLFLNVYPERLARSLVLTLRGAGLTLYLVMMAIFRRRLDNGHLAWLDFSYPEILGLIGLTYIAVCLLYIPTRRFRWAPFGWLAVLLLFNIACVAHWIVTPTTRLPMYLFPFDNGAFSTMAMAGIAVSAIFFPVSPVSPKDSSSASLSREAPLSTLSERQASPSSLASQANLFAGPIPRALLFAVVTFVLGYLLRPLGISKLRATPTWALWSVAAAAAVFTLFFYLLDIRRRTVWAAPLRAPGANTLLTYLLPDLTYYLLAFFHINFLLGHFNYGLPGLFRSFVYTALMLALSYALTRARLRLQL